MNFNELQLKTLLLLISSRKERNFFSYQEIVFRGPGKPDLEGIKLHCLCF